MQRVLQKDNQWGPPGWIEIGMKEEEKGQEALTIDAVLKNI